MKMKIVVNIPGTVKRVMIGYYDDNDNGYAYQQE